MWFALAQAFACSHLVRPFGTKTIRQNEKFRKAQEPEPHLLNPASSPDDFGSSTPGPHAVTVAPFGGTLLRHSEGQVLCLLVVKIVEVQGREKR